MKKRLFIAVAGLLALVLLLVVVVTPKLEPDPPLPVPNGYDDFVKAAAMIDRSPPDWWSMKGNELHEALTALASTNQAAIELVRVGLTKECRMAPWDDSNGAGQRMNDLAASKALAQAMNATSKLALMEGRTNEAAALAADCIQYGTKFARGGVLIDQLVGVANNNIGLRALKDALPGMTAQQAREVITHLEEVVAQSEPYEVIITRERRWARLGRFGQQGLFSRLLYPILTRKALSKARPKFLQRDTDILRMQIQLAAHAFALEQGKPPASASELVPRYLKSVPVDPATGTELPLN